MKINGGIIIATNPIARYGTSLKYSDMQRIQNIGQNVSFAASGDYSDFQKITEEL